MIKIKKTILTALRSEKSNKFDSSLASLVNNKGQSILEVILAVAIFGLIAASMMTLVTGGFTALFQGGEQTQAEALVQEGIEAVKSIRDGAWNELTYTTSSVGVSGNQWIFSGENTSETIGKYTRIISFDNVCRDVNNNITNCPGSYTDVQSKKATVSVVWNTIKGEENRVEQSTYLTNWDSREWTQTDWSGGSGQSIWSDSTKYDMDNGAIDTSVSGEVALASVVGDYFATTTWHFDVAGDYTYNPAKIQVAASLASLLDQGGGGCSGTPDACSTFVGQPACVAQTGCSWSAGGSGSSPAWSTTWGTYADWESGGNVNGTRPTSGGNPTNYIDIRITRNSAAQTASGYWQRSFTTTVANPDTATMNFDWRIPSFNGTYLTSFIVYVFVDNFAGPPTIGTQVWSQTITGTTSWARVSNLNVASKLTTAGTYYIKLVARRIKVAGTTPTTNNIVGFDNVSLNWTKNAQCSGTPNACNTFGNQSACLAQTGCSWASTVSYPTDNPTVYPNTSFSTTTVYTWTGFAETATKNGGEIYYQLSEDDGATWQYWNGSAWITATQATDYNTASVVNTNILEFSTSTAQIKFKAFLSSDGTQLVQLDAVEIGLKQLTASGNYAASAYFVSSAYNTALTSSKIQVIEWDETQPANTDIKLQVRTAPDSGGSPGVWTSWYGATGAGTYFIEPLGSIIPIALNGNRWVQYRAELSGDAVDTPILQEVRINYK